MRTPGMSCPLDMTGRVVLVTGGAGNIGSLAAAHSASLGATAIIADTGTSVTGVGEDPGAVTETSRQLAAKNGAVTGYHHKSA